MTKKTKIVATMGPACEDPVVFTKMIENGLNVVRMNFSHGEWEDHARRVVMVRNVARRMKKNIALLQDLSGPKIRIGDFPQGPITLTKGEEFTLSTKKIDGNQHEVYVNYKNITKDVQKGTIIKLDDGKKILEVKRISDHRIVCEVLLGGPLSSRKGVNVPGVQLSVSSLTAKDKRDVLFGIQHNVDFIAFSFVQTADDVRQLRRILDKHKSEVRVIAKIETVPALNNLDEIIAASDGIMVARGDLAIEIGIEQLPLVQKEIIEKCNLAGKPVITATQMLESMEEHAVPTRAEVSDIANAILDGSDAVMLSSESTIGKYPVEAVAVMNTVAQSIEQRYKNIHLEYLGDSRDIVDSVTSSAVRVANNVRARAIVALTESGFTAQMISRFKAHHPILALTEHEHVVRRLALSYGVCAFVKKKPKTIDEATRQVKALVGSYLNAKKGEKVVVALGIPFGKPGSTNMIFVVTL